MPDFKLLKRGQRKVPKEIIKNKRAGVKPAKRSRWQDTSEDETTLGLDALGQALKDTGWVYNDSDISAYS